MRVLVVEDDFASRQVLTRILAPFGWECDTAFDGVEAHEAIARALTEGEPYRLILLDLMLPRMGGQSVLRSLREMEERAGFASDPEKSAYVVVTTALCDETNLMESARTGCDGYLHKPFTKEKMIEVLKSLGLVVQE